MVTQIVPNGRTLALGRHCYVIAEAGVNHNGDMNTAEALIDAAKAAGADAVKFQTFRAEKLVSVGAPLAQYQIANGILDSQFEMIRKLELDEPTHRRLMDYAQRKGIVFLSTPFDEDSSDLLERLGLPLFKIPSGEITNKGFLKHVARKKRPLVLSTGMSDLNEVGRAIDWIRSVSAAPLTVLHCVTDYPAPPDQVNLRAMDTIRDAFGVEAGYSDHTLGTEISVAAAARGAALIEKHLTLDRGLPGPDHAASLEPAEFGEMVRQIHSVVSSLGDGVKRPAPCELKNMSVARKSLVANRDLPAGRLITAEDLSVKRPGTGLPPADLEATLGRSLKRAVKRDQTLTEEDF